MTLDRRAREATCNELNANFELSALTPDEICSDLGISRARLDEIFGVELARPEDVWALRDYLEAAVQDRGLSPVPYSSLTPAMRSAAKGWFPLRPPTRHAPDQ